MIEYNIGELWVKVVTSERKNLLRRAQDAFEKYLHILDTYRMLPKGDLRLYERYSEGRDGFSLVETKDAAARRNAKITRFNEEKDLKAKLEVCQNKDPR